MTTSDKKILEIDFDDLSQGDNNRTKKEKLEAKKKNLALLGGSMALAAGLAHHFNKRYQ